MVACSASHHQLGRNKLLDCFSSTYHQAFSLVIEPMTMTGSPFCPPELILEILYITLPKAQSAISSHQKLVDAQGKAEKDLESYTKINSTLSLSVSKGKAYVDQLSIDIQNLERQLAEQRENKDNLAEQ